MALDLTSYDLALKDYYDENAVKNMVYSDRPLLAMLPKDEKYPGRQWVLPTIVGNPQGRSRLFTQAQTRGDATTGLYEAFLIDRAHDYGVATIDNETLEASEGNVGAFMEASTTVIDGVIQELSNNLARSLYRDGFGSIGNVNTTVTGTTLTLSNPQDIVNFEKGMQLCFASDTGTSTLRAYGSGTHPVVTSVNRSAGSMVVGNSLSNVTSLTSGDFIFIVGDREDSATATRRAPTGLAAWCPSSAPASTAFHGLDRTIDSRLYGSSFDGTTMSIDEALYKAAAQVGREGGKLTHYFMSFSKYAQLEAIMIGRCNYVDMMVGEIGFRGIVVNGPKGPIKVFPDTWCPSNRVFGLQMDTWKLKSMGKLVKVIGGDGLQWLRQAAADGVELRYGNYLNLGCRCPGWNVNIQVTA